MYGIPGVNDSIKVIAEAAAQKTSKALANEALTKTEIYPVVKKSCKRTAVKNSKKNLCEECFKSCSCSRWSSQRRPDICHIQTELHATETKPLGSGAL